MQNYKNNINLSFFPKQAVILVGGLGTRLKELTKKTPKPLLNFDGKPFLDYQINYLSKYQFREIVLLCHYKSENFKSNYHNKIINNCKIICIFEKKPLGTGGALINAKKHLDNIFFLCNGDTFFEIDLIKFNKSFNRKLFNIHVAVQKSLVSSRYHQIIKKKKMY